MIKPQFIAVYLVDNSSLNQPLVLLLKRQTGTYFEGIWQMVTGKVDHLSETILKTAAREVKEETGLELKELYSLDVSLFYDRNTDGIAFSANFLGFVSRKLPIVLSKKEHAEYKWCSIDEAIKLVAFAEQKKQLQTIQKYYIETAPAKECLLEIR